VNSAEENRPNFCKGVDGKPLFSDLYNMYALALKELKAILKVSAQAGQSGTVNKTSVESVAQDDDFQQVQRCKRHICCDTSQTAKNSTKPVPTSPSVNLPPKAALTRIFFTPLRTADMDMETTCAENALSEQEAPRKPGTTPPVMMTSTTNLIQLQSDIKDHIKGECDFRNTQNGTCVITKEMADYSAMKSYLEKNNLYYFTFSPNSEKPIKAIIHHIPPDTPAENISSSLEELAFNIINMRQMTATQRAPDQQIHLEPLPLFLFTLTRNIKCQYP
jgi:hypothetical protein